jgi:hypothetical protein
MGIRCVSEDCLLQQPRLAHADRHRWPTRGRGRQGSSREGHQSKTTAASRCESLDEKAWAFLCCLFLKKSWLGIHDGNFLQARIISSSASMLAGSTTASRFLLPDFPRTVLQRLPIALLQGCEETGALGGP